MYSHQDWTEVKFNKKQHGSSSQVQEKHAVPVISQVSNKPAWKIEKDVDSDVGKPVKYVSKDDARAIVASRIAKKMSQKDLAISANMQLRDIQDIENCKAIENKMVLAKIKRILNI